MKATHSKSQKQTRLPIRYLYFILSFKPLIDKEVIKVFQNYIKICDFYARPIRKEQFFRGNVVISNMKK